MPVGVCACVCVPVCLCVRVALMRKCLAAYMYLYAPDVAVPGSVGGSAFSFADVNSLFQKKKKNSHWNKVRKKIAPHSLYPFTASAMEPN